MSFQDFFKKENNSVNKELDDEFFILRNLNHTFGNQATQIDIQKLQTVIDRKIQK